MPLIRKFVTEKFYRLRKLLSNGETGGKGASRAQKSPFYSKRKIDFRQYLSTIYHYSQKFARTVLLTVLLIIY